MSLRFRRSMKLMPGVRLNFSKSTVGMSFGVPGARYTINSKGRRTVSAGIPGTGIYDVTTLSSGRRKSQAAEPEIPVQELGENEPRPGLFSSKAERALHAFLRDIYGYDQVVNTNAEVVQSAGELKALYPKLAPAMDLLSVLHGVRDEKLSKEAYVRAEELWPLRYELFGDRLVRKYFKGIYPGVSVTRGIFSTGIFDVQAFGFLVTEVYQAQDKFEEAIKVLGEMAPNQLVGISLADIEISAGDFDPSSEVVLKALKGL